MRISKKYFIAQINKKRNELINAQTNAKHQISATDIYNIFINTLTEELFRGNTISLKRFGIFKLKLHKGHKVQFTNNGKIDDYLTIQFIPSDILSKQLRSIDSKIIESENITDPDNENDTNA